jgi:peptidoglycan/LPS O-acetylase OafA/YrhL
MTHVAGEGSFAPGAFAVRRILRILPLYWVCTLLVFAVALAAPALFKTTTADAKHLVLSLFFIPAPDPAGGERLAAAVQARLDAELRDVLLRRADAAVLVP